MNLYGRIAAADDTSPVERSDWDELRRSHPYLAPGERNIASERSEMDSNECDDLEHSVGVVVRGVELGCLDWKSDGPLIIEVWGTDRSVASVARAIAVSLSAVFVEIDGTSSKLASEESNSRYDLSPKRQCAKCGGEMTIFLIENVTLNLIIPSGQRIYFRCAECGKEIKLRNPWRRFLLLTISLCLCPAIYVLFSMAEIKTIVVGLLVSWAPLSFIKEIVTRIRYPGDFV